MAENQGTYLPTFMHVTTPQVRSALAAQVYTRNTAALSDECCDNRGHKHANMRPEAPVSSVRRSKAEKNGARRKRKRARAASACTHDPNDPNSTSSNSSSGAGSRSTPSCELADGASTQGKPKHGDKKKRKLIAAVSSAEGRAAAAPTTTRPSGQECTSGSGNDKDAGNPQQQQRQQQQKKKKKKKKKKKPSLAPSSTKPAGTTTTTAATTGATTAVAPPTTNGDAAAEGSGVSSTSRRASADKRMLGKALEVARKKHRQDIGKGRPLVGWDIGAFSGFIFQELAAGKEGGRGEAEEGDEVAVASAVAAVTAAAEQKHAGQV